MTCDSAVRTDLAGDAVREEMMREDVRVQKKQGVAVFFQSRLRNYNVHPGQ